MLPPDGGAEVPDNGEVAVGLQAGDAEGGGDNLRGCNLGGEQRAS